MGRRKRELTARGSTGDELMLKSESFNVYTTDLGEEGVDLGKLYDYDIILLDLNLPDMSALMSAIGGIADMGRTPAKSPNDPKRHLGNATR